MSHIKYISLVVSAGVISGCQSLSVGDIDTLPPSAALPDVSEPGWVELRYFDNIPGNTLSDLDGVAKYPDNPDTVLELSELEVSSSRADNYASLVRGYIEPPITGTYRFFVSGDDQTTFSLSTDRLALNSRVIASVPSYSSVRQFGKFSSQVSGQIELTAGKLYYFELRHKEGIGGDHFSVAWEGPGFSQAIIGSENLHSPESDSERYSSGESIAEAFRQGYRVGYFDGENDLAFNDRYPPLDEDGDGLYDNWEVKAGLDPSNPGDAESDLDDDLLTAQDEYLLWTKPNSSDTDGDGIPDGAEFAFGLDARDPEDANLDLDGDGYTNLEEYEASTGIDDPDDSPQAIVATPDYVPGLMAQYFSGRRFDTFSFSRFEQSVNHDWGGSSPGQGISNNNFSARWYTYFLAPTEGGSRQYRFVATRDDSVRLEIDGELVIDSWAGGSGEAYAGQKMLSSGTLYPVTVEFSEGYGSAFINLQIIDVDSGQEVDQSEVFRVTPFEASVSGDADQDGIPDAWELEYGSDPFMDDASQSYNSQGVSLVEAYEQSLNPWSLEPVESWDGVISSGSTTTAPDEPETNPPETTTPPETVTVTLSWTAPGTRADGTSIALSEIESYRVNYGNAPNTLDQSVSVPAGTTSYVFDNLGSGNWYFSVQVIDVDGLISQPSEVVNVTID